ncbi:MAG TPA: carbohydrate ABC transporter permease [Mesotoga sp.]|nr:carbohydrate ABC transporter permease [Mesotoga sp.]MDI9374362.1 carbohydrate ABC transporter permease [Thermotogota bacterium]NLX34223.1 carbohydrate ABC transporter permease [Thermotogaceae bacterium]MDD4041085.1 carbohydrate ABC transporter permease [Mesotoga sp.]MDD4478922.1 carbohydrate ABC transporter permease [Mesotoga sp.]
MLKLSLFGKIMVYILLAVYCLVILVPFFMMILNSLKSMRDIFMKPFSFPTKVLYDNYTKAWNQAGIGTGYKNSAFVAGVSVIGILIVSSMFAYAISKYEFKGRRFLFVYSMLGLAFPARLAIIPIFILLRNLTLTNSLFGLILIYTSVNIPFSVFLLKNFIDGVPNELSEAARIDGATPMQIYWKVVLPLVKPALSIVAIVSFVNVWNDFFFPLIFINDKSKATITLAVSIFFGEYSNQWPLLFSGLTLAIAPTIILFLLFSRQFITGMTQGAIK